MAATNVKVLEKGTCCCVTAPDRRRGGAVRVPLLVGDYYDQAERSGLLRQGKVHEVEHAVVFLCGAVVQLADELSSLRRVWMAALNDGTSEVSTEDEPCRLVEDFASEDEAEE